MAARARPVSRDRRSRTVLPIERGNRSKVGGISEPRWARAPPAGWAGEGSIVRTDCPGHSEGNETASGIHPAVVSNTQAFLSRSAVAFPLKI
ncbi:hypothetical protein MPTK1_6g07210 [Marchantia polymorpha subsp. ruderalis]|uniref:Uncharacterized protein n=2 Tax=Marchantia polymorpha TaxID=3197 RepID=A0AAF6BPF4_MARPO|nr:hypothetical protein MARPO_0053s0035 [Marchantia polymorpha]BBN13888.1 hypothetical protein Mp_6g07210 [Marchantia polymorpha subsp. ruderalis]|eukprot:PTQ38089.1 hypothetical protein MARPO_0053s0035 [Marchantia polymorpha]